MRKPVLAVLGFAMLAAPVTSAEAAMQPSKIHGIIINHPGCQGAYVNNVQCIHGIILHRVCVRWEVFGGERHCVQWANKPWVP
jgi:hypothetical protein